MPYLNGMQYKVMIYFKARLRKMNWLEEAHTALVAQMRFIGEGLLSCTIKYCVSSASFVKMPHIQHCVCLL